MTVTGGQFQLYWDELWLTDNKDIQPLEGVQKKVNITIKAARVQTTFQYVSATFLWSPQLLQLPQASFPPQKSPWRVFCHFDALLRLSGDNSLVLKAHLVCGQYFEMHNAQSHTKLMCVYVRSFFQVGVHRRHYYLRTQTKKGGGDTFEECLNNILWRMEKHSFKF